MRKIMPLRFEKLWGYEIWLASPLANKTTMFEDQTPFVGDLLIKIIQANDQLSVQVHPDDRLAKTLENLNNGKSESWYVLDAKPGARLVLGLKNYDKDVIKTMLELQTFEANLNQVMVSPGEFFNIPAGLVHGIGANLLIFEVQQPSDITYRYYDYNRFENGRHRDLHIAKALQAQKDLDYHLAPLVKEPLTYVNKISKQIFGTKPFKILEKSLVVDLDNFIAYEVHPGEIVNFKNYCVVVATK